MTHVSHLSLSQWCKENALSKTKVWKRCQELNFDVRNGLTPEMQATLAREFGVSQRLASSPPPPPAPGATSAIVEVGNHRIIVATPQLPQTYSLGGLRTGQAQQFENPLALAQQFVNAAQQIREAMQEDIQQREQTLAQTRAASQAVQAEAEKLSLEARLYQLQTQALDRDVTAETQELQRRLMELQNLGKPPESSAGEL